MFEFLAHQLQFISNLGKNPLTIFISICTVTLFLIKQKHFKTALVSVLTSISLFYSFYLKQLFQQLRPENALNAHYLPFDIYSFPSTHVVFYTTFWGFIFYLTYKYTKEAKLLLHVVRWVAVYMIVSIGASRLFLGVHYLKDIVGGYFYGLLFLTLLIWLNKEFDKMLTKNQ